MSRFNSWQLLALILLAALLTVQVGHAQEKIEIDAQAQATPFPHYWEQMFGSGRAILSLRESYRDDLRAVKQVADFRYVRFHAILHDELGSITKMSTAILSITSLMWTRYTMGC